MHIHTKKLQAELNESDCVPIFEIEIATEAGDKDWLECNVYFLGNSIVAERGSVSTAEEKSVYIPKSAVVVDPAFSLDAHLEWLLEEVQQDIIDGDFYSLGGWVMDLEKVVIEFEFDPFEVESDAQIKEQLYAYLTELIASDKLKYYTTVED